MPEYIPEFSEIKFDDEKHAYTYRDKPLISVTTLIGKLSSPFDSNRQAVLSARKSGVTVEQKKQEWRANSEAALRKGSKVHYYIENYLKKAGHLNEFAQPIPEFKAFDAFWASASRHKAAFVHRELLVGDYEWGIGGTIDAIISFDFGLLIWDWKTGKIDTRAFRPLLPPFDHIGDTKLNRYSLQVSLYRLILERNAPGLAVDGGAICHLTPQGDYDIIAAEDFREDWLKLLHNGIPASLAGDPKVMAHARDLGSALDAFDERQLKSLDPASMMQFEESLRRALHRLESITVSEDE